MPGMNRRGRGRALVGAALLALLSGCATSIIGSEEPPFDWVADAASNQCVALSGNYLAAGMPAPANSHAGNYGAFWPTEGSLLSIIERGTNANPRKRPRPDPAADPVDVVVSISIIVDASGTTNFEAKNAKGGAENMRPKEWSCESGTLTSLVSLSSPNFDSHVRLWKHDNDLIAEQTILETNGQAMGSRSHRPVVRFHFRFPSTAD
jgi:hypothetical protein